MPFQVAFEWQKTADIKHGPLKDNRSQSLIYIFMQTVQRAKHAAYLLVASQGRDQSEQKPVAKKQHKCNLATGEKTGHCHVHMAKAKAPIKAEDLQQGSPPTAVPARQFWKRIPLKL